MNGGMSQIMNNVRKLQQQFEKEHKEKVLNACFECTKNGLVKVVVKGDLTIQEISILDDSEFTIDNKDMILDLITIAVKECKEQIDKIEAELFKKYKSTPGGMFF